MKCSRCGATKADFGWASWQGRTYCSDDCADADQRAIQEEFADWMDDESHRIAENPEDYQL
jgi:hypothetical protein